MCVCVCVLTVIIIAFFILSNLFSTTDGQCNSANRQSTWSECVGFFFRFPFHALMRSSLNIHSLLWLTITKFNPFAPPYALHTYTHTHTLVCAFIASSLVGACNFAYRPQPCVFSYRNTKQQQNPHPVHPRKHFHTHAHTHTLDIGTLDRIKIGAIRHFHFPPPGWRERRRRRKVKNSARKEMRYEADYGGVDGL